MLWWIIALGAATTLMTFKKTLPPSRELVIKLGTLMNMAERADEARYADQLAPITPFVGTRFVHRRIKTVAPILVVYAIAAHIDFADWTRGRPVPAWHRRQLRACSEKRFAQRWPRRSRCGPAARACSLPRLRSAGR